MSEAPLYDPLPTHHGHASRQHKRSRDQRSANASKGVGSGHRTVADRVRTLEPSRKETQESEKEGEQPEKEIEQSGKEIEALGRDVTWLPQSPSVSPASVQNGGCVRVQELGCRVEGLKSRV